MTPDDKYSLSVKASVYRKQFKCNYLEIKKTFSVFCCISGIYKKFWILWKKRWALEGITFWNYKLQKAWLLKCQKKPRVRTLIESQHVKRSERLRKSARQFFCHIFWTLRKEINSKNSVLVVSEILRLFVSILTPHDKYSLWVKGIV